MKRGLSGQNTNPSASAPGVDRRPRILEPRDAANLHEHRRVPRRVAGCGVAAPSDVEQRAASPGSAAVMNRSPIRNAR